MKSSEKIDRKMNRIILLFTALLFFGTSTVSEAQEEWTLQKCIDYALENNIQIKRQELNTQYSRNQVSQARADRLPNLNAGASNNFSFGRSLNNDNVYENVNSTQLTGYVNSNLTLFNGFTLQNTIEQNRLDLQAALQDLQKTK